MADLATWKNWVDILQDVVQTLAIIVAGGWAIWRFWINRERHPKADIQHSVECFPIGDSQHLVHVAITVKNVGSVLMKPTLLLVRILQVLPLDEEMQNRLITGESLLRSATRQGDWVGIGDHELEWTASEVRIEPSESHTFVCDFHVRHDIAVFQIYSYLKNPEVRNKNLGWGHTTMHKNEPLRPPQPTREQVEKQERPQPPPRPPAQAPPNPPPRKPTPPPQLPKK